jgi:hypothetical protein
MRPLTILFYLLLGLAPVARAEVVIFDGKTTSQSIRPGLEYKLSLKEFFVWDLISHTVAVVSYSTISGQKVYNVFGGYLDATAVTGQAGRSYAVFSAIANTNDYFDTLYLRGQTAVIRQRSNAATYFPRTIKGQSRSLNISSGPRLLESSHSYVFSQKRTVGANDLGLTQVQVISNLVAELSNKGYRDIREFSSTASSSVAAMNVTAQALRRIATAGEPPKH